MAINTRDRRASAGACGLVMLVALPTPDGTISAADRAHSAGFYAGITVGVVTPIAGGVAVPELVYGGGGDAPTLVFNGGVDAPTLVIGGGVDAPTLVYSGGVAEPTIVQGGGSDEPSFE